MVRYALTRCLYMVIVLFIVTTITFFLVHGIPGDPITTMVEDLPLETRSIYLAKYGFDQPLLTQYGRFFSQMFRGDMGQSIRYPGRSVTDIVRTFAPVSAVVGGLALFVGFTCGILFGIIAALKHNQWPDKVVMVLAILGTSIPTFATAAVLQYALAVKWPIFPATGWGTAGHMILPVLCMCVDPIATYARYMRSNVLDVAHHDYILTAEAKGISRFRIVTRHMFRNSFVPCISMICVSLSGIFFGSFIVESIFAIPGIGRYFISAINDRDYSVVLGLNIVMTGVYILFILLSDLIMAAADPRIRYSDRD